MNIKPTFSSAQPITGKLRLGFTFDEKTQQSRLNVYAQQPPLKVIRAFPVSDGGALVHLHNVSGGVLGGDQLDISVHVGTKAYAQLTSTSATRIYRSQPHLPPPPQTLQMSFVAPALPQSLPPPPL